MPCSLGFPFPYHLSNFVHLDILLFIRVILVHLGCGLVVCGLEKTSVSSCEIREESTSDNGHCMVSLAFEKDNVERTERVDKESKTSSSSSLVDIGCMT